MRTLVSDLAGVLSGVTRGGLVHVVHRPPSLTVVPDGPAPVDAYLTPSAGGRPTALTVGHDVERGRESRGSRCRLGGAASPPTGVVAAVANS